MKTEGDEVIAWQQLSAVNIGTNCRDRDVAGPAAVSSVPVTIAACCCSIDANDSAASDVIP